MKYLINNADDLGWGVDITRGIIDSHVNGVLSSASVIVNEIDNKSIELIKNVKQSLGIGLHLNVATGTPVSKLWKNTYPIFSHPGRPSPDSGYNQVHWDEFYLRFNSEIVFEEFESQYNLFCALFEQKPTHIDTHYNTFSVGNVFKAFKKLAVKYDLASRRPGRYFGSESTETFGGLTSEIAPAEDFIDQLEEAGVKMTNYFSPQYMNLHQNYLKAFEVELGKINDGESLEISFHPGYREEWRRRQVEILIDPQLKKCLKDNNVEVVSYRHFYDKSAFFKFR